MLSMMQQEVLMHALTIMMMGTVPIFHVFQMVWDASWQMTLKGIHVSYAVVLWMMADLR